MFNKNNNIWFETTLGWVNDCCRVIWLFKTCLISCEEQGWAKSVCQSLSWCVFMNNYYVIIKIFVNFNFHLLNWNSFLKIFIQELNPVLWGGFFYIYTFFFIYEFTLCKAFHRMLWNVRSDVRLMDTEYFMFWTMRCWGLTTVVLQQIVIIRLYNRRFCHQGPSLPHFVCPCHSWTLT